MIRSNSAVKNLRGRGRTPSTLRPSSSSTNANAKAPTLSYHDVGAVRKKLTVLDRKANEALQKEALLKVDVARLETELDAVLESLTANRRDEQELVLRVVEARLLHDSLVAANTESNKAIESARRRLHDEKGNNTIKHFTYTHLKAVHTQRAEEVNALEEALASVAAQMAAIDAESALLERAIETTERSALEVREDVERQASRLGVVVDSVANALDKVDGESRV